MKVLPLPDGRPSQHLGISHTLKHYLAPAECWSDLASDFPADVPASARPTAVRERLPSVDPAPWKQAAGDLHADLRAHWEELRVPYRRGYLLVVQHIASATPSPDEEPGKWLNTGNRNLPTCQLGSSGILLRVKRKNGDWQLYTAFRDAGFKYFEKHRPQTDPTRVSQRRMVASIRANTLLDRWRTDGDPT